jgi:hypothetical protein
LRHLVEPAISPELQREIGKRSPKAFGNHLLLLFSGTKFAGLDEWSIVLGNCFSVLVF